MAGLAPLPGRMTDEELLALMNMSSGSGAPAPASAPASSRAPVPEISPADIAGGSTGAQNAYGAIEPGNMDLSMRPHVKNPDGSVSTVRSMGFQDDDGKEVLIPTVNDRGYIMSDDDAIKEYRRTGRHLGKYGSVEASNAAAEAIHRDQESKMPRNLTVADDDLLDPATGPALAEPAAKPARGESTDPLDALIADETDRLDEETKAEDERKQLHDYYANRAKQASGTEPGEYERIYRETHSRPAEWRRILAGVGGALAGRGDGSYGVGAAQEDFDSGLAAAMGKDLEHRRGSDYIDEATAHLLMKYYGLSPEQAANVRKGSEALGLMNNMGSLDLRKEELEARRADRAAAAEDRDLERARREQEFQERMEFLRMNAERTDSTRRYGIDKRKGSGGGGGSTKEFGSTKDLLLEAMDSTVAAKASAYGGDRPFTLEMAKQLREGTLDPSTVDPKVLEIARQALSVAKYAARTDPKKLTGAFLESSKSESANLDAPGVSAAKQAHNIDDLVKEETWINDTGGPLVDAMDAWEALTNAEKSAIVNLPTSPEGWDISGSARDLFLKNNPGAQKALSTLEGLQNVIIKERSGASVSNQEMMRLWAEVGKGKLKSPQVMTSWLNRLYKQFQNRVGILQKYYPDIGK